MSNTVTSWNTDKMTIEDRRQMMKMCFMDAITEELITQTQKGITDGPILLTLVRENLAREIVKTSNDALIEVMKITRQAVEKQKAKVN